MYNLDLGSHSFAKFNAKVSYFQYEWTRAQGHLFNNQVLKHLAERPQYFSNCQSWKTGKKDGFYLTGDYLGQAPNTTWRILYRRSTENGGPFQWHHIYYRCKATNYCSTINEDQSRSESKNIPAIFNRAEPAAVDGCCDDLGEGEYCKPIEDCERWIQNDETAMNCEVGFYLHFDTDEDGKPTGCEGFDEKWLSGKCITHIYGQYSILLFFQARKDQLTLSVERKSMHQKENHCTKLLKVRLIAMRS